MTKMEKLVIAAIVAILGIVAGVAFKTRNDHPNFIAECSKTQQAYQCEVLWKQMHPDPIVILAPLNR